MVISRAVLKVDCMAAIAGIAGKLMSFSACGVLKTAPRLLHRIPQRSGCRGGVVDVADRADAVFLLMPPSNTDTCIASLCSESTTLHATIRSNQFDRIDFRNYDQSYVIRVLPWLNSPTFLNRTASRR